MPRKTYGSGTGAGRANLFPNYSREGARREQSQQTMQQVQQHQVQTMPAMKPKARLPQHRQTNLANVMESIREEEPHV